MCKRRHARTYGSVTAPDRVSSPLRNRAGSVFDLLRIEPAPAIVFVEFALVRVFGAASLSLAAHLEGLRGPFKQTLLPTTNDRQMNAELTREYLDRLLFLQCREKDLCLKHRTMPLPVPGRDHATH